MNKLQKFLEYIKIKRLFGKYISKASIKNIIDNPKMDDEKEIVKCGYIILEVSQNEYFEETVTDVCNYYVNTKNFFVTIYGTFIEILLFNRKNYKIKNEININKLIEAIESLDEKHKKNLKGIYGITNAKAGFYGGHIITAYMVLLDNYSKKIMKLNELQEGEIIEVKE